MACRNVRTAKLVATLFDLIAQQFRRQRRVHKAGGNKAEYSVVIPEQARPGGQFEKVRMGGE